MKKKVLIAGGAGFIGSHTADLLINKGYSVVILDNLSRPVHDGSSTWPRYLNKKVIPIRGDVANLADWKNALDGIDFVIHLAAYQDLLPNFSRFFQTNVVGTANLYETIVVNKLPIQKVVVASSQFVYGEGKYRCPKHGIVFPDGRDEKDLSRGNWEVKCPNGGEKVERMDLTEDHANPQNQYSISKCSQELIGLKLGKLYRIPSVAMRYSIVQGARQSIRNQYSGVLRLFTTRLMLGIKPVIFEDGMGLRDFVNVADVAEANVVAMESKVENEVYNVGGGKAYTVIEFEKLVERELKTKLGFEMIGEYRVGDTRHSISDISKLIKLGWKPSRTVTQSIKEYYEWVKGEKIERSEVVAADRQMRLLGTVRPVSV